jgi:YegS/Rv2252/BmrU family lipid kinase
LRSLSARRAAIIYNPVARGLSRNKRALESTPALLAKSGIEACLVPTVSPGSAGPQAREQIQAGCDLIIAAGGDGTINEVIDGMRGSSVALAILPGGTANVLAREIKMPVNLARAAAHIASLESCRIALGALRLRGTRNRSFVCMTGVGLDAEIVSRINLDLKAAAGKLAYYACGFSQVFRPISEFQVTVDGKPFLASFALVSRVRNYGGDLEIARGASLLRDDFEIVLFQGTASVQYLGYLAAVLARQIHRSPGCTVLYGRSLQFEPPAGQNVFVQVDGELAGNLPASIELLPDALTLLVPPEYLAREQAHVKLPA